MVDHKTQLSNHLFFICHINQEKQIMFKISVVLASSILLFVISGCTTTQSIVDEKLSSVTLPPIEQPAWQVGMIKHQIDAQTGAKSYWTLVNVSD